MRIFAKHLLVNIFSLHNDLINFTYRHASYERFCINDPKPRIIHKATVRDRLLHHAIYRILYPAFDTTFIFNSFSCRKEKGTHKAFQRMIGIVRKVSHNYLFSCWALKCDIKKFFDSVNHQVLIDILKSRIDDNLLIDLLTKVIESFAVKPGKGMPLGNLTSQLFANVYLDPLDKFVKHKLRAKYYLRYADDFLLFNQGPNDLLNYLIEINSFLQSKLKLFLHPNKIILRKINWGIDFVGYVALPYHIRLRTKTKKRMFKKICEQNLSSYLGLLKHCNCWRLKNKLKKQILPFFLG